MVSKPYIAVLALGKARLLFSRKVYGTSFAANTCVIKAGFELFTFCRLLSGAAVDFSSVQILSNCC